MTAGFHTLGCKVNQYETQYMKELLERAGFTLAKEAEQPDVFVINSCTVTAESDRKTRQLVRRYRALCPGSVIVLTGCMPQAFPKEASALKEADVVLGNGTIPLLPELVRRYMETGERQAAVNPHGKERPPVVQRITGFSGRTKAFLKIEDGCDRFCSYCIIPTARGRVRSKPLSQVRKEASDLGRAGFRELVLIGINLSAYGREEEYDLADAAEAASRAPGVERVRLGSLEPDQLSDEMISRLAAVPGFCPQFHLSLQSGCDETLRRMNRHYDTAFYRDLVCRLRSRFPDCSITTDIMVGFPGETEPAFLSSLSFCREIGFSKAHVFPYSPRRGTKAAEMPGQVEKRVKERRAKEMLSAMEQSALAFHRAQVGKTTHVLVENRLKSGELEGYTPHYVRVRFPGSEALCGQILPVRILHADVDGCQGELVL